VERSRLDDRRGRAYIPCTHPHSRAQGFVSRTIAIANQKGGVGKTTTAVNLAASLAVAEKRTLVVDVDPQGNATSGLGVGGEEFTHSVYDALVGATPLQDAIVRRVHFPLLDLVPATQDLVGVEVELLGRRHREHLLANALAPVRDAYDYVLLDCPPSLGLLTLNTLTAADSVLIPIQSEFYALEGLSQLLNTVRIVQRNLNPSLQIDGVLLTMFDGRLNLSKQVAEEAREYFGANVYKTSIPRNVRIAEAPSFGKPIVLYDVMSQGAKSYLSLAREVIARGEERRIENSRSAAGANL
jgi:chromosome partitioning protein